MDHPSQIFSRIRRRKARPDLPRQGRAGVAPAPTPLLAAPATPAPEAPPTPEPAAPTPRTAPRPAGGHALYSQIMRSHDRMGTRHL